MIVLSSADVRTFLKDYLVRRLGTTAPGGCEDLPEGCDLLLSGMIDSIGLLDLVAAIQEFAGREIDFEILDPEEMTVVGPLCKFVSEQVNKAS
jgi:acyl carrier protein